jgi:hypothetical protein
MAGGKRAGMPSPSSSAGQALEPLPIWGRGTQGSNPLRSSVESTNFRSPLAQEDYAGARRDLYEILEERYGRRSTILTSQIPVDKWHAFIGDPTYADAILDRLVHNAHRIDLAGESLRRRRSRSIPQD